MRAPGQTGPGRAADPWDIAISSFPNWTSWTITLGIKTRTQHPGRAVMGQCGPHARTPHCAWTPTTVTGNAVHTRSRAIAQADDPSYALKTRVLGFLLKHGDQGTEMSQRDCRQISPGLYLLPWFFFAIFQNHNSSISMFLAYKSFFHLYINLFLISLTDLSLR